MVKGLPPPSSLCQRDFAIEADDVDTPRLMPGSYPESPQAQQRNLPEPALMSSRSSFSDADPSKRVSVGSVYSLTSARGVPTSGSSVGGSDGNSVNGTGAVQRSVSGLMTPPGGRGLGSAAQSEAGLSNITVTTGSQSSATGHHLAPRESHVPHLNEVVKRNPPSAAPARGADPTSAPRPQPTRSRSRAKRRFSGGSTAASSHSPSSDRALHRGEREEIKPAPWGVIGVCALDIKARSKPSRNILNRLIANRDFDVCVFGDKVILDEGKMERRNKTPPITRQKLTEQSRDRKLAHVVKQPHPPIRFAAPRRYRYPLLPLLPPI